MGKSDREKHAKRIKKQEKKKQNRGSNPLLVDYSSSGLDVDLVVKDIGSEEELSGSNLRIVYLSNVPRKDDIGFVEDVLEKMGKPREWANLAHLKKGKARFEVYQGVKTEAREIARQLEFAGAKLVRC